MQSERRGVGEVFKLWEGMSENWSSLKAISKVMAVCSGNILYLGNEKIHVLAF
jgi:hypothetical protein